MLYVRGTKQEATAQRVCVRIIRRAFHFLSCQRWRAESAAIYTATLMMAFIAHTVNARAGAALKKCLYYNT